MKDSRQLTAWRIPSGDSEVVCHLKAHATGVAVSVARGGRRIDGAFCNGPPDESLHQAWHRAVALYRHYREVEIGPTRPKAGQRSDQTLARRRAQPKSATFPLSLRMAVQRVEFARALVSPFVKPGTKLGQGAALAVKRFRDAWEILDLECQYLTGRGLSPTEYERRFAPLVTRYRQDRASHHVSPSPRRPPR